MKQYIKPDFILMDGEFEGVHSATSEFNFQRVCEDQTQVRMKYFWTDAKATDGQSYGGNDSHVHTKDCQGNEEHIGNHVSGEENYRNVMQGELFLSTNQMADNQDILTIRIPLGKGFTYSTEGAYRYVADENGKLSFVPIEDDNINIRIVNDSDMIITLQNVAKSDNIVFKMGALSTDTYTAETMDSNGHFNFTPNEELPDPLKGSQIEVMSSTGAIAGVSTLTGGHTNFDIDYYMEHGEFNDPLAQSYIDSQKGIADWQKDDMDSHGTQVGYGYNAVKYQFTYSYDTEAEWAKQDDEGKYDWDNVTKDTPFKYTIKEIQSVKDKNGEWVEKETVDEHGNVTENKGNMATLEEVLDNIDKNAVGKGFTEDFRNELFDKAKALGNNAEFSKEISAIEENTSISISAPTSHYEETNTSSDNNYNIIENNDIELFAINASEDVIIENELSIDNFQNEEIITVSEN